MGVLPDWMIERDIGITPLEKGIKREGIISYGVGSYGIDARIGYKFKVFSPINATEIDPKNFDPKALVEVDLTPKEHEWTLQDNPPDGLPLYICKHCGLWTHHPESKTNCGNKPNYIRIPPHSFILGETIEEFNIPRDVICIVIGKSTYARCGLIVNVTPGEPEWCGRWTVEISNTTPLPARVYCGEGIMQCLFIRTDGYSEMMLNDIKNLYQIVGQPVNEDYLKTVLESMMCQTSYKDKRGKYNHQVGLTLPKVDEKV